ncbi:TIP-1 family-domain-containing protein [Boeremia exigua]|uniref:TIP-1 family-domain-containing protein n=1 Tax=Boeremia exigua TaxID=749465 RepID=UPI001E8D0461|nr:TIP-1 family-domain-containing protein [Boeremia exigua]KAH6637459.1 TIP-1 family-domain-containing protein [Boeremia exigua]
MDDSDRRGGDGMGATDGLDGDARVLDFLDDKLQTAGDLDALDELLASITARHGLLKQQLDDARRDLDGAQHRQHGYHDRLQTTAAAFHSAQHDIDRRLLVMTASETSDDAVPRFEAALGTLQRLDVASGYIELLRDVDALSTHAQAQLQTSSEAALAPYQQLRALHTRLLQLQHEAEGAAPQLLHHVAQITHALRARILDAFAADLDRVLKKLHWPTPKAIVPPQLREEWETAVVKLLDLQMPELEGNDYANAAGDKKLPPVLFPFEVLVQPLEMRFRYHFEGAKPTNRLDRPEYFLSHVTTLLDDYSNFVSDYMQPVLFKHFRGTDLALNPVYIDAMSAFITALLPVLRTKISSLLPKVATQPQLLSHLMHEIMSFDSAIRDTWAYDGGYGLSGWHGLSWEFLVQGNWFDQWLRVEKEFALGRYQSIVEADDWRDLDYESVDPKATKPTKGAIRVNDLLETITDRYRPLTSFKHKLAFLIDIQIAIFDQFHERLNDSLEAYLRMTTALGRAMGGVSREEQDKLLGIEGLESLCRTYGSADYLEKAMRDWSDDVFFLDIWEELQDRAQHGGSIGTRTVASVAERTSRNVGASEADASDAGGLFDETASWYARLRERSEQIITETLVSNVRVALKPYRQINPWATLSTSGGNSKDVSSTAELDPLLSHLSTTLTFLSRVLAPAPLRRIARAVLATINTTLFDTVLRVSFSTHGAAQLNADLDAIRAVVDDKIGPGVAALGLRKCLEGATLVGLPVKGGKTSDNTSLADDDDGAEAWDAWAADDANADARSEPSGADPQKETAAPDALDGAKELGLWEVEKRLFADNASAREVLDALGLEVLDEKEARRVLRLRVELAG